MLKRQKSAFYSFLAQSLGRFFSIIIMIIKIIMILIIFPNGGFSPQTVQFPEPKFQVQPLTEKNKKIKYLPSHPLSPACNFFFNV